MATRLEGTGASVRLLDKRTFGALFAPQADHTCFFTGESAAATLFETAFYLNRLRGLKNLSIWYHNRSAARVSRYFLPFLHPRTKHLVLNSHQITLFAKATVYHFPNSLDGDEVGFEPSRHPNRNRLVWLGRLERVKGFDTAYGIFQTLNQREKVWTFDVYGSGGDCDAANYPDANFHGWVSGPEAKKDLFAPGGIFLFPSEYENETQPLVVLEAMRSGLPILISRQNSIDQIIRNGNSIAGESFDAPSVQGGVQGVLSILDNYDRLSKGAREIYRSEYSATAFDRRLRYIGLI